MGSSSSKNKKSPASRVDKTDRAILDLKINRDKLIQHRKKLELFLPKDEQAARKLVKN